MKEKLLALYALQQLDSALDALKREYAALDPGREEKATYDQAKTARDEATAFLHRVQTDLKDIELQQQSLAEKRAQADKKLYSGAVRAPKELMALQEEIEMFDRQRGALDEKQIVLMEELETGKRQDAETKQALQDAIAAFKAKQATFAQDSERMKGMAKELLNQRNAAAKDIAPDLLKRYDSLRTAKNGVAIVALIQGNACGGCNMAQATTIVKRFQTGSNIETCQNCGRMLCEVAAEKSQ